MLYSWKGEALLELEDYVYRFIIYMVVGDSTTHILLPLLHVTLNLSLTILMASDSSGLPDVLPDSYRLVQNPQPFFSEPD